VSAPTRRERFRPLELVIGSGILGLFTGVVVLAVTRQPPLAAIFTGVAFISALLVLAMLALAEGEPERGNDDRPLLERHDGKDGEEPPLH
jgi:UDP-N-acetylmuramyl pentapeptide phosphotransferase/UDP-N-acetylglucosamine-1-phosphate transferase